MAWAIGRPINGVTINGLEYVLDDEDELMLFDSIEEAKEFLRENGIDDDEIEAEGIEFEEVDE